TGQVVVVTKSPVGEFVSWSHSLLAPVLYQWPHSGHFTSLCRPIRVGAIEPVGMTKASATNPRKRRARMMAIATDSMVSLQPPSAALSFLGSLALSFSLTSGVEATFDMAAGEF